MNHLVRFQASFRRCLATLGKPSLPFYISEPFLRSCFSCVVASSFPRPGHRLVGGSFRKASNHYPCRAYHRCPWPLLCCYRCRRRMAVLGTLTPMADERCFQVWAVWVLFKPS
ncbi:hypothetical protein V6N12_021015 [Hibiscus sabdariffa]|uniref:Uncharacterized protein n=1 Tax=Hibiscus sabdariffa TaxID=183260 RepID=A0ABR2B295_9ROSI